MIPESSCEVCMGGGRSDGVEGRQSGGRKGSLDWEEWWVVGLQSPKWVFDKRGIVEREVIGGMGRGRDEGVRVED